MREYETTLIIQPEITDEAVQTLFGKLDDVFTKHGSLRLLYDDQGRRRMAYEIQKFQKGRYVTAMYLDEGTVVEDLEKTLRLDDSILRFLTVQVSTEVKDIPARQAEAEEMRKLREQRAAERAQREAEEAAARAASEAERAAAEAEREAKAAEEAAEGGADAAASSDGEAAAPVAAEAAAPAAEETPVEEVQS